MKSRSLHFLPLSRLMFHSQRTWCSFIQENVLFTVQDCRSKSSTKCFLHFLCDSLSQKSWTFSIVVKCSPNFFSKIFSVGENVTKRTWISAFAFCKLTSWNFSCDKDFCEAETFFSSFFFWSTLFAQASCFFFAVWIFRFNFWISFSLSLFILSGSLNFSKHNLMESTSF